MKTLEDCVGNTPLVRLQRLPGDTRNFEYAVALTPADGGGFVVTCRDLPQLVTQGEDMADAMAKAADAMDEVFAAYMQNKLDFPPPSRARRGEHRVAPPAATVAKAALYVATREAHVTNTQLAQRLGVDEKEVRRLLDPHYASKLPRIAKAVAALGKRLVIGLEPGDGHPRGVA